MDFEIISDCVGFEWDSGNIDKNWKKHRVNWQECEEVFFNRPIVVSSYERRLNLEPRGYVLGQTNAGRKLFLVYTIRDRRIRIISARSMSRKERKIYDKQKASQI